jgi:hypothetical protein
MSVGTAGRSAAREAERRSRRERFAVCTAVCGAVAASACAVSGVLDTRCAAAAAAVFVVYGVISGRPVSRRWAAGAAGEERTAAALAPLSGRGFVVFHDVRLPGRDWNIDHLVIGPRGVAVVDSKRWAARRVVVSRRHLRADGDRRDAAVDHVVWQVTAAARALGRDVPTRGFLCIHGSRVRSRWFWRRPVMNGVLVGDDRALMAWLRRGPRLVRPSGVATLAKAARKVFVFAA